jgi:hypothetical protein
LPSGSLFSVSNLPTSSYQGKSDTAFTGGSSHLATVVSKDDQIRLLATASAELESQALDSLKAKLGPGETLLDKAITSKVDKKKFSRDVDTESESVTLDLTMVFTGLVFDEAESKKVFLDSVVSEIPSGYVLPLDGVSQSLIKTTSTKTGDYVLNLSFSGVAVPSIEITTLSQKFNGKTVSDTEKDLKKLSGVDRVDIKVSPGFISIFKRIPLKKDSVKIEVVSI